MLSSFQSLENHVKGSPKKNKVVLAAAADLHSLMAMAKGYEAGLVDPVLVGVKADILEIIERNQIHLGNPQIVDCKEDQAALISVDLIREGAGDFLMKGHLNTSQLLREVVKDNGGIKAKPVLSHLAFLEIKGYPKLIGITDGGMVIQPTLEQKKEIIINSVEVLKALGCKRPNVAVLAGAEVVNPKIQASLDGQSLKEMCQRGEILDCYIEGPISFDLMISQESATLKEYQSPVTANTDLLVVPDMTSGNIMAKAIMYTAKAQMSGVVLGGLVPIVLTSRGATVEEKYLSTVMAGAIAMATESDKN